MDKITKNPKFEIYRSEKNSRYYWRLYASNGKIILKNTGKGFATKQSAKKNIRYVIAQGESVDNYMIETANINGTGYYFTLLGKLGTVLGVSANGKFYQSCNWQVAEMGVNKGISACIKAIGKAKNKPY